ncbi:hypothetical protein, partial [Mesomycoplasma flocculare]|uniref:hypothetical protein n=1 Tax=Mesomycoplasma flocculare TaxID=2128 RepID=UPI002FE12CB4
NPTFIRDLHTQIRWNFIKRAKFRPKKLAYEILEKFPDNKLEYVYQFVVQRIKTGFRFDSAPESDTNTVAILEKDENLSFKFNENNSNQNTLIIGENYDGLKNLLVIERERERERRLWYNLYRSAL